MRSTFLCQKKADFFKIRNPDCEKTTRTISKIPKDAERARASPQNTFFILVSEFGKWLFRNILEVAVSRIQSFIFLIVGYRYNPFKDPMSGPDRSGQGPDTDQN